MPDFAVEYIELIRQHSRARELAEETVERPGNLARGAPRQFAEFVAEAFIEKDGVDDGSYGYGLDRPRAFTYLDNHDIPPAPQQGAFLEL